MGYLLAFTTVRMYPLSSLSSVFSNYLAVSGHDRQREFELELKSLFLALGQLLNMFVKLGKAYLFHRVI